MTLSLHPYLFFDGGCRAAFEHYRSVFGGEFSLLLTFAEGPPEMPVAEGDRDRIMHVSLPFGSGLLMGSDTLPGQEAGSGFRIAVTADSRAQADSLFAGLAAGGSVDMAMADVFWGSYFGTCTDRFGVGWMVDFTLPRS